ncbi:hypothetical protein DFP72DRAFT_866451 [Ephemerocybe angulata]|uniref:Uncharacterized protein n=1 Tax=Ephemerocybe angulata TaxID=980116 RepID=A0A8H6IIX7_9AGAR|nr:hypothetical protein DFP72DRAFT_866451 [Tulosesus angulatus]
MASSGPVTVDDTDSSIQYSPQSQWNLKDVCIACDVSSKDKETLENQAFNATWHVAPGAQVRGRNLTVDFKFSGSNVNAMFIFFRRTDGKGQTRDDGKSSILLSLDNKPPQRLPLTLEGWTSQELQQKYRFSQFLVDSPTEGDHTLNIQLARDNAMESPVTFALDYIRFTPMLSASPSPGGSTSTRVVPAPSNSPPTTPSKSPPVTTESNSQTSTTTSTAASPSTPSLSETATSTASSGSTTGSTSKPSVSKIVGPVVGLVLAVLALALALLCWRQRRRKKHLRLKASIRPFKPVLFDSYYQKPTYAFYRGDDDVEKRPREFHGNEHSNVEKPSPTFPPFSQRVSIRSTSIDSERATVEPVSPVFLPDRTHRQRSAVTASSFSSPARPLSYVSYEQQWKAVASQKRGIPITTTANGELPLGGNPPYSPFVVTTQ